MRKPWIVFAFVAAGACGWFARSASSEDAPAAPACTPEQQAAMEALAQPGEMHTWLGSHVGTYDLDIKTMDAEGKPATAKATATIAMVLGGRFQEQRLSGTFMGKPYEGYGLTGYDNAKKEFVNYWFDTMGTAPSVARGARSADGKSLAMAGTWDMPTGPMPFKQVVEVTGEKTMTFKMTATMGGAEMTMMEATYTRK